MTRTDVTRRDANRAATPRPQRRDDAEEYCELIQTFVDRVRSDQ